MKVVIVEDYILIAQDLQRMLTEIDSNIEIVAILESIKESVEWFSVNPSPDLVFMDIELLDGWSFKIFEKVKIHAPVIFNTAYNQYAVRAFEANGIDYFYKPVASTKLEQLVKKFSDSKVTNEDAIAKLIAQYQEDKANGCL